MLAMMAVDYHTGGFTHSPKQSFERSLATASATSALFKGSLPPAKLKGTLALVSGSAFRCMRLQVLSGSDPSVAEGTKWWQKGDAPNLRDVNTTQEFLDALSNAGEKLAVVEFFATWCGSCKALYPKLCQIAADHPEIDFLKVNFDENKTMCKNLNVKVLPFFHFYRGAEGRLDAFSCSLSKIAKLKEAIAVHNTDRCSIGPPVGLGEDLKLLGLSSPVGAGNAL